MYALLKTDDYKGLTEMFYDNGLERDVCDEAPEEVIKEAIQRSNFILQEKLIQHSFFSKLNPLGINSIRLYAYRSVKTEEYSIINLALRMGKGGSLHRAGHPQTVRPCDFADSLQDGSRMPSWVSAMIGFEHRFSVLLTAHW